MAEKVSTKDAVERMSAATTEAANDMQHSYAIGLKGVQDYNKKCMEFAQANTKAAMEFFQKLSVAKSPTEFIELSTTNAQRQLTTLTEQTKELGELAQKATLAAVEPLKTGFAKTFGRVSEIVRAIIEEFHRMMARTICSMTEIISLGSQPSETAIAPSKFVARLR